MSEEGGDALLWHPWEFGRGLRNESDPTSLPISICRYTYYRIFSLILHVDLCLLYRSPTPSPMLSSFCPSIFFNIYSVQSPDSSPPPPPPLSSTLIPTSIIITLLRSFVSSLSIHSNVTCAIIIAAFSPDFLPY